MQLLADWQWYQQNKSQWLPEYRGQFLVIQNQQLIGHWPTFAQALQEAYQQVGLGPFLVQQLWERDHWLVFT